MIVNLKLKRILYKIYNFTRRWILSEKIFSLLVSISHNYIFSKIPKNNSYGVGEKILKFKKNDICILIGNGPSTGDFDLSLIPENFDIVTINQFFKSKYSNLIKSNFHICAEPFDGKLSLNNYRSIIENNLTHNSLCYVLHPYAKKLLKNHRKNDIIYHLNNSPIKMGDFEYGSLNLDARMPLTSCTGNAALAICIALSYKKIYIVGMDQNQLSSVEHVNKHFYEKNKSRKDVEIAKHENFYERLIKKSNTIKAFLNLTKIAESKKIEIYNISYKTSMIDFWNKVDYESLINNS